MKSNSKNNNKGSDSMTDNDKDKKVVDSTDINKSPIPHDPLDGLVERCKDDPSVIFKTEVIEELKSLKNEDFEKFESLRNKLKKAGGRVGVLDTAIDEKEDDDDEHEPNHKDILLSFTKNCEFFHWEDEAYADIHQGDRRITYNVKGKRFENWLRKHFYDVTQDAPDPKFLQKVLDTVKAKGIFGGPEREVFLRVAPVDEKIYIDLGGDDWSAIEVDKSGWRPSKKPPVRFRRPASMRALPSPKRGGNINDLKPFLNVKSHDDFVLIVTWLLVCLSGREPFPVLVLMGEQGTAKSTTSRLLRSLVDPKKAAIGSMPQGDRDLYISTKNSYVLAFDNVSHIKSQLSDSLSSLATGGSFATRKLRTDDDEILFEATRPILANGIGDIVKGPDLAERALFIRFQPIPKNQRRTKRSFWKDFEEKRSSIFGALLDVLVVGLNNVDKINPPCLERMAEFSEFGLACEPALWEEGTFWRAHERNRNDSIETVIDADPVSHAVRLLMKNRSEWSGTATELLKEFTKDMDDSTIKIQGFPTTARVLSERLGRAVTFLREMNIDVKFIKRGGNRIIHIMVANNVPGSPSAGKPASSAPSASKYQSVVSDEKSDQVDNVDESVKNLSEFRGAKDARDAKRSRKNVGGETSRKSSSPQRDDDSQAA
ncbi:MAG: hypothetical protein OXF09_08535 [Hyphomicrobiales bacterium]|nr:hypothetical protein [Hyphomicrobiales bacterium]